jgi:putative membrane protein
MALLGLGGLVGLVGWFGFADIASAFARAGWGIAWVAVFHFVPIACDTMGWRQFFRPQNRARVGLGRLYVYRWICESVNNLLPVAHIGGDVVRARLASKAGAPADRAGAATIADFTIGLLTQMVLALIALAILVHRTGLNGWAGGLLLGVLIFSGLVIALLVAQISGFVGRTGKALSELLRKITRRTAEEVAGATDRTDERIEIDGRIADVYRRRGSVVIGCLWRLASWSVGAVEVLLALYFLGLSAGFGTAFVIHVLTMSVRSIAFVIPAGLAAQEGGFLLVGDLLGFSGPDALALALIRRARELLVGVPGLIVWWSIETRHLGQSKPA